MKMTITIPYRPSRGGFNCAVGALTQQDNGKWLCFNKLNQKNETDNTIRDEKEDIVRCIHSINKNSHWRHDILVLIDFDVTFKKDWEKQFGDNVKIFKATDAHTVTPQVMQMHCLKESAMSLPDDALLCYALNADVVVAKNWDIPIAKAYEQYGNEYVYVPMFVEPRTFIGRSNLSMTGTNPIHGEILKDEVRRSGETTTDKIWNLWRKEICCHSLTILPPVDTDYIDEADLDKYIEIASRFEKDVIKESCGLRKYGYWAPLIAKCSMFKKALPGMPIGIGGDLYMDTNIPAKYKIVVTKSFIFHFHIPCKLDNIEVKHE